MKERYVILEGGGGGGLAFPAACDSQISARDLAGAQTVGCRGSRKQVLANKKPIMSSFMLEPGEGVSERLLNDIIKHVASYMRMYTTVRRV